MKKFSFTATSILTALGSSVCCIIPAVSIVAGTSSLASLFLLLQPFRPYFIVLAIISLGVAWYKVLFQEKEESCDCERNEKRPFFKSKTFLSITTISAVLLITFPSYSHLLIARHKSDFTVTAPNQTITIPVKGMTCAGCEMHVEAELHKLAGVSSVKASHTDENAIIQFDDDKVSIEELVEAINRLHYQATNPADSK
jgi:mercuric ion transport protein